MFIGIIGELSHFGAPADVSPCGSIRTSIQHPSLEPGCATVAVPSSLSLARSCCATLPAGGRASLSGPAPKRGNVNRSVIRLPETPGLRLPPYEELEQKSRFLRPLTQGGLCPRE